jgi:CHAT domain-containing protein
MFENSPDLPVILNNLAICLRYRFELNNELTDLDNAIDIWYKALRLNIDSKNTPGIFSNLGEGLRYRYTYKNEHSDKGQAFLDLNKAIEFSQEAINSSSISPTDKAGYLSNLGGQLIDLYNFMNDSNKQKEANDALDRAIEAYNDVISLSPKGSRDRAGFLNNLGRALRAKYNLTGDVSFLFRSFCAYDEASKSLYSDSLIASISYKIGIRKRLGDIDDMLIETALKLRESAAKGSCSNGVQELNWGREAMIYAEGIKSSILVELLGRRDIPVPPSIPSDLIEREGKLLKKLNDIDLPELSKFDELTISKEKPGLMSARLRKRGKLTNELGKLWCQMESYSPESREYITLRRGDRPSWGDLRNLIKDPSIALLSLIPLAEKTVLFILQADWEEPKIIEIPIGSEAQLDIWRRFRREVHLYDSTRQLKETWDHDLIQLLKEASNYLTGIKQVIFSPGRFGCLLPWETLLQKAGVNVSLTTVPNLKIWSLIEKYAVNNTGSVLVIGNPMGGDDLIHAEEEAKQIAHLVGAMPLIGSQATKDIVMKCLPEATIAHFATHAYFSLKNPLDSGIILADGVLTIREIIDLNIHLKLLVLSACETGMNSSLGGDEMAGFAQGFILAGARSTLVSLWKVDDLSTESLMVSFYNRWINDSANNAEALSYAMTEVRNHKKWEHTYYWGAFTLIGDTLNFN